MKVAGLLSLMPHTDHSRTAHKAQISITIESSMNYKQIACIALQIHQGQMVLDVDSALLIN